jgi:hypothetical protein
MLSTAYYPTVPITKFQEPMFPAILWNFLRR